jgi:hypothetical protein
MNDLVQLYIDEAAFDTDLSMMFSAFGKFPAMAGRKVLDISLVTALELGIKIFNLLKISVDKQKSV